MSSSATATAPWPSTAEAPAGEGTGSDDGDGPGRLRIDPRVVQKLVAEAANEVEGVSRASAGPISRALHRPVPAGTPPDQLAIDLDLSVSIRYPLSLCVVAERLAAHVSQRVEQLTGRPVGHVRVNVQHLVGPESTGRPRVR